MAKKRTSSRLPKSVYDELSTSGKEALKKHNASKRRKATKTKKENALANKIASKVASKLRTTRKSKKRK